MKPSRYLCSLILIPAVAVALLVKVNFGTQAAGPDPSPDKAVQDAWKPAQEIGVYHFNTDIERTTYPAPAIANVVKSSSTETFL